MGSLSPHVCDSVEGQKDKHRARQWVLLLITVIQLQTAEDTYQIALAWATVKCAVFSGPQTFSCLCLLLHGPAVIKGTTEQNTEGKAWPGVVSVTAYSW